MAAAGVDEAVLCLLQKSSITCIYPSGSVLETPLLQPCTVLWALTTGVLMAVSGCAKGTSVCGQVLLLQQAGRADFLSGSSSR